MNNGAMGNEQCFKCQRTMVRWATNNASNASEQWCVFIPTTVCFRILIKACVSEKYFYRKSSIRLLLRKGKALSIEIGKWIGIGLSPMPQHLYLSGRVNTKRAPPL